MHHITDSDTGNASGMQASPLGLVLFHAGAMDSTLRSELLALVSRLGAAQEHHDALRMITGASSCLRRHIRQYGIRLEDVLQQLERRNGILRKACESGMSLDGEIDDYRRIIAAPDSHASIHL